MKYVILGKIKLYKLFFPSEHMNQDTFKLCNSDSVYILRNLINAFV